ncbi:DNA/RNA non-specific endonuclease [Geomonas subterranea]|uniref:Endonuclease n=1 Tax=Geomonas subterranea TaxID=2847989 RepID=A0ABX8LMS9_9BACT|nr:MULTISPECIES: DNA/RNA non-specific endonuclease [Geomonas]QXE92035.1 DNA/RNA non-specific endonuclease [Geomonas subterranea]QXM09872.1 DNA/RNA non-specific endonuclease [Geomonas subterranea]
MPRNTLLNIVFLVLLSAVSAFGGPVEECQEFAAYGVPGQSGDILCRKGYLLSHDALKKTPVWVVERMTRERLKAKLKRANNFRPDADLPKGERAELSDYRGSGYDRGHMAPAADMAWDEQAMSESFYLSNMVPQAGEGMNRGIWADLEGKVRKWVEKRGELYIYSGPVYSGALKTIGRNHVAVPSALYKVILDPARHEALALIMPNEALDTRDMPKYLVPVREVERQTGLDFFSALPREEQDRIETPAPAALWQ